MAMSWLIDVRPSIQAASRLAPKLLSSIYNVFNCALIWKMLCTSKVRRRPDANPKVSTPMKRDS